MFRTEHSSRAKASSIQAAPGHERKEATPSGVGDKDTCWGSADICLPSCAMGGTKHLRHLASPCPPHSTWLPRKRWSTFLAISSHTTTSPRL